MLFTIQNGIGGSPKLWLVHNGDQCTETTGGWHGTAQIPALPLTTHFSPHVTEEETELHIYAMANYTEQDGACEPINFIDFTNWNTLKIDADSSASGWDRPFYSRTRLGIYDTSDSSLYYQTIMTVAVNNGGEHSGRNTFSLDISGYSGLFKPQLIVNQTRSHGESVDVWVYNMWLEL